MQQTGNTVLITGGGTGIGKGLAEAFHEAGNQVIITGRRTSALEETVRANPGMRSYTLDVENAEDVKQFARQVTKEFPALNVLINNAGIMQAEDLKAGQADLGIAEQTVGINLLGTMRLTAALLPTLLKQPKSTVVTVSSGLAFVPIATNPAYCATKAAIHSWTQSLRYQLRDTPVEVLELPPPYVQTELTGAHQKEDPNAMPLDAFLSEVMELLKHPPASGEILVQRVMPQRTAEREGKYDELYAMRNEQAAKRAASRK